MRIIWKELKIVIDNTILFEIMKKKSGISPVIATVILIAVAVAIAIAVAFWAAGVTGAFTKFEELKISNSYVTRNPADYTFTVSYKNAGPSDITIEEINVNDRPLNAFWSTATVNGSAMSPISIKTGASGHILVSFPDAGSTRAFVPGQTIELKILTASGVYYVGTFLMP